MKKQPNPANHVSVSLLVRDERDLVKRADDYVRKHGAKGWSRQDTAAISGPVTKVTITVKY